MQEELIKKSNEMKKKRQEFLVDYLNPHEKEMNLFIKEVIKKCGITSLEEWIKTEYLIPDCASRLIMRIYYEKLDK